jgi:hypothetical protein
MIKVIALDIDGVLINSAAVKTHRPDPVCVAVLNSITDQTRAGIVVSSSWRKGKTRCEMADLLTGWGVTGTVVGLTPSRFQAPRGHEIQAWLDYRKETFDDVGGLVILDDDTDMAHLSPWLVLTSFSEGLTTSHVTLVLETLNRPWDQ